jgi:lipopolysaccharide biosynthesis glycosyltransferase
LDTDITEEHKEILRGMIQGKNNFSLRFVPIASYLRNWKIQQVAHVPARSYYRLWIPTVLKDYKKVLYIDCDLVVCHDLAELYQTDIGDNYLAGVKDADFQGQINRKNFDTMEYAKKTLHLDDPYSYVQAGVLLFNIDALNREHKEYHLIEDAKLGYRYMDQDVLNRVCQGKIHFLDQKWNVINDCNHERIKEIISYAPHQLFDEYMKARKNPFIIHYAGKIKPWTLIDDDFCEVFWTYAMGSSFFIDLVSSLKLSKTSKAKKPQQSAADRLLPKGTKRREIAVSFVRKISSIK